MDGFQDTIFHMLQYRITVTKAASGIQDDKVRGIVTKTLIVGQIIVLLSIMKEMQFLNDAQYNEFTAYLMQSSTSHSQDSSCGDAFLSEPKQ
jgi:hypothetical protein